MNLEKTLADDIEKKTANTVWRCNANEWWDGQNEHSNGQRKESEEEVDREEEIYVYNQAVEDRYIHSVPTKFLN